VTGLDGKLSRRALLARSSGFLAVGIPVLGCSPRASSVVVCAQAGRYTRANLGLNYPWLDNHRGEQSVNWLNENYDRNKVRADLKLLRSLGVTKTRTFCQLESVMGYDGSAFSLDSRAAGHLHDFLDYADRLGVSVIVVMTDGHLDAATPPANFDGKFRWELVKAEPEAAAYLKAIEAYIKEFRRHGNVAMWEIQNEPYGSLTWATWPQRLGVTAEETHRFLVASYQAIKPLAGSVPVGFSDLEEKQQDKYTLYSDPQRRRTFVDDCTDVYSMHCYRSRPDELFDFTTLAGKPKWCTELGSYNYRDPTGAAHNGLSANNELYDETKTLAAVQVLSAELLDQGFELVMPWGLTSNAGWLPTDPMAGTI
jgi:hypothetical protein